MLTMRHLAMGVMGMAFAVVATCALEAQTTPSAPQPAAAAPAPPPGPGLAIITAKCSACHTAASVFSQHRSPDDWAATVQVMMDRGADLSPDEANVVIGYLAENFPAETKPAAK
jgi:mono/diheme cytochrome c family protein